MERNAASVLIIEDDPRIESLERALLEERGYSVTSTTCGEDAIDLVSDSDPDLILLDVGLPGIDGFTACKVIRKFSETPIIMVTANNSVADKVKGMETGADDYITKPFSHEEFLARANTVLRRANFVSRDDRTLEQDTDSAPKYTVRREGKPPRSKTPTSAGKPRWAALQQNYHLFRERLARELPIIGHELARDSKLIYVNATGQEVPARDSSSPAWRYYWYIVSTLTVALARIGIQQTKKSSALLRRWAQLKVEKTLADHRSRKSVRGVHYSSGLIQERVSSTVTNTPEAENNLLATTETAEVNQPVYPAESEILELRVTIETEEEQPLEVSDVVQPKIDTLSRSVTPTEQSANSRFLDALLTAYLIQAEARCEDPMLASPVIPLLEIHPLVGQSLNKGGMYTKEEFAREIYQLQAGGTDTTQTGARVQFPISRGVPGKILNTLDSDGGEVRYYGIRFIQTDPASNKAALGRTFDLLEGPLYGLEIRELFGKQLAWPSTEFTTFLASQLQLEGLTTSELRLLAQITRDSPQRFIQEQTATRNGSLQITERG